MDILPYLATLLKERKAVSLDGFGTFVKTKVPGRFDVQTQSYLPPSYKLGFSTEITTEGELARFISEQRNLSVNTTGYYIGEYVTSLNNSFAETGEVILPGIGTLSRVDGELRFDAEPALDLGHDFFGFPAVPVDSSKAAADISQLAADSPQAEDEPDNGQDVPNNEAVSEHLAVDHSQAEGEPDNAQYVTHNEVDNEPLAVDHSQADDQPDDGQYVTHNEVDNAPLAVDHSRADDQPGNAQYATHNEIEEYEEVNGRGYLKWLIIAFILVAVIAGVLIARPDLYGKFFGIKADTTTTAFDKDSLKNSQDTLSTDSALKNKIKDVLIGDTAAMKPAMTADSTLFEIFALSVKSEATARKYMERFDKMGFAAKGFKSRLRINISVASFASEREALDSLPAVRKKLKDPTIFVKETKVTEPQITHTTQ